MQERQQNRAGDNGFRGRVFGNVAHFGAFEQWQDGNDDGSRTGDGLVGDDDFGAIEHHHDDAVTFLNAQRTQTRGQLGGFSGNLDVGIFAHLLLLQIFVDQRSKFAVMQAVVDGQVVKETQVCNLHGARALCHTPTSADCVWGTMMVASPMVTFSPFWFCAQHSIEMEVCPSTLVLCFTTP